MNRRSRQLLTFLLLVSLTGCNSFGPDGLKHSHPLYNEALAQSMNEQILLNLVRQHYNDPTFFLDVINIASTMKFTVSGSAGGSSLGQTPMGAVGSASEYYTQPTISYAPMQGEEFVKSLLAPIDLEKLYRLMHSGWSLRRIFGICIERINAIENAPTASGPQPAHPPVNHEQFLRLIDLLELLHQHQAIRLDTDIKANQTYLHLDTSRLPSETKQLQKLLELDMSLPRYRLGENILLYDDDLIVFHTRTMMGVFYYLSQGIETPAEHISDGLVKQTTYPDGRIYDWSQTSGGKMLRIHSSRHYPEHAFLAIHYRDYWFYIADADITSKASFTLLTILFRLQSGAAKTNTPALTIPVR